MPSLNLSALAEDETETETPWTSRLSAKASVTLPLLSVVWWEECEGGTDLHEQQRNVPGPGPISGLGVW